MGDIVRILMNRIIDYAGLFPPAKLDLPTSLQHYTKYMMGDDNWALSHFVIPQKLLENFPLDLLSPEYNYNFSLLPDLFTTTGSREAVAESFLKKLTVLVKAIEKFEEAKNVKIAWLEIKLNHHLFSFGEELLVFIVKSLSEVSKKFSLDMIFFEIPFQNSNDRMFSSLVAVLSLDSDYPSGIKFRTGGITPDLFPSLSSLSQAIKLCAKHGIAMKATAGLHSHIRHFDKDLGVWRYGYLNVFLAMMMAVKFQLSRQLILELLSETDVSQIDFDGEIRWKEFALTKTDIEDLRSSVAISYGSCNYIEPLEHLRGLGLLT